MTTYSPPPTTNLRAVLLNLLGVVLLLAAGAAVLAAAWLTHPYLGLAVTAVPVGALGWRLATSDA